MKTGTLEHTRKLFDKPLPTAAEAEMCVLGSMILDPRMINEVCEIVTAADFHDAANGTIYTEILNFSDKTTIGELDLTLLYERLKARGVAEEVGGSAYLMSLAEGVAVGTNAPFFAKAVASAAAMRRFIEWTGRMMYEAFHANADEREGLIERAEQDLFGLAHRNRKSAAVSLGEILHAEMRRIDSNEGTRTGIKTGFSDLDKMLGGLIPGEMIVLAARPSMGKSALALGIAEHVAMNTPTEDEEKPVHVALFSLEMSKESVACRLVSCRSCVDGRAITSGALTEDQYAKVWEAYKALASAPLLIDDTASLTSMQLRARARRLAQRFKLGLIVVDYLQLLTGTSSGQRENRQVEVSDISRAIKAIARELNVPVLVLSQLNRASEQREGNRPRMSDLRESGSIEQDADVVMLLHREDYYHAGEPEWEENHPQFNHANAEKINIAEVIVAKQRNGPTGSVKLVWQKETTRFWDLDRRQR